MILKQVKKNSGVSLVMLLIIVISLIILSGVTIATLTGENRNNNQCTKSQTRD